MITLREAYEQWQNQIDDEYSVCCNYPHHFVDDVGRLVSRPDTQVCRREQAWRVYVRVRDNNPNFPFNEKFYI